MDLKALTDHFDAHHAETKTQLDEVKNELANVKATVTDIEQKASRRGGGGGPPEQAQSIGAQVIADPGLKDFANRNSRHDRFEIEIKANTLTSATTNATGSVGTGVIPYRDPTMTPLLQRRPVVRSLLPVVPITTSSVDVLQMVARTSGAAPVAEGAAKPQSDFQLSVANHPARVIAHWMKASRQMLEDMSQLMALIDSELSDGLDLAEDTQLLFGDGTGQNLTGLVPQATAYSAAFAITGETGLDRIGLALLQSALALQPASGIVMSPTDWVKLTLLKDGMGRYILGDPNAPAPKVLWGVPVVDTVAMPSGNFLVGNFRNAATLYDRWTTRVEVGVVNDDFTKNLITVLAEKRLLLGIRQPLALTYGTMP